MICKLLSAYFNDIGLKIYSKKDLYDESSVNASASYNFSFTSIATYHSLVSKAIFSVISFLLINI